MAKPRRAGRAISRRLGRPPRTPFRRLLGRLDLDRSARVLDLGAGGFVGETTTRHLVDAFDGPIVAVERNPPRADALAQRFGAHVEVVVGDAFSFRRAPPFDLVVIDIDSNRIPAVFELLLAHLVDADVLVPGGVAILTVVTDLDAAYQGPNAMSTKSADVMETFFERRFGGRSLDLARLAAGVRSLGPWSAVVLEQKFDDGGAPYVGWAVLRRDGPRAPA